MTLQRLIALALMPLALAACGSAEKKPPTVGEAKDFATVCDKTNDGKRVAVDGYLRFPGGKSKNRLGTSLIQNGRLQRQTHWSVERNRFSGQSCGVYA